MSVFASWSKSCGASSLALVFVMLSNQARADTNPAARAEPTKTKPTIDDPELDRELENQFSLPVRRLSPKKPKAALPSPRFHGPRFQVGYRLSQFACAVEPCWYHQFSLMFYPIAFAKPERLWLRMMRIGLGMEAGGETTQKRDRKLQRNHHMAAQISLGIQYPWRVTPYLDWVLTLGSIHRNIYNKDAFIFAFSSGLDVGGSVFIVGPLNAGLSLGWRRYVMQTKPISMYYDTFVLTLTLGF